MENLEGEIWKPIIYKGVDYTGLYEVSNNGMVKGLKRSKILKYAISNKGYKYVVLSINNKQKSISIHRLVANCFIGELNKGFVVDHVNSNPLDNFIGNLQIITIRENSSKEKTFKSKLPCGITRCKYGKFMSFITVLGEKLFLGRYKNKKDAANSYEIALLLHNQDKCKNEILSEIDKYRVSIGIEPVRRKISELPRGVHSPTKRTNFISKITINSNIAFLGTYDCKNLASKAYQIALSTHEQGKPLSEAFKAVDMYRESINLKPIKRRNA